MSTGLAVPIRLSTGGGFLTESGDRHASSILKAALGDGDNANPFQQDIALGVSMIFASSDGLARGDIVIRLEQLFRRFEIQKRFKLKKDTIRFNEVPGSGELYCTFKYVNLESDEEDTFNSYLGRNDNGTSPGRV